MRNWCHLYSRRPAALSIAGLLIAVVLLAGCGKAPGPDAGWSRVTAEVLATELAQPRPAGSRPLTLVDVREPELYAEGHIPGAINIPWPGVKESAAKLLPRDHAIVMICHGGPMGDDVAELLVAAGFTDVRNLKSGMRGWHGPLATGT
ncbi:MAG: rhodanese-like domain-containing protein [Gammaproteobacteria bacterium]